MAEVIKKIKVGNETHPIDGAFYLGALTTVAGSGSSGSYKSVRWYVSDCEGITAPYDGMRIAIKIPLAGVGTAGVILSINGNTDADYHPLAYNVNTVLTTHFPVNSIKVFVYDANQTMTCYKTAGTAVSVTGVWKADSNYDSNTVVTYGTLEYYFRPYVATEALYRYKFVMLDKDNRLIPLTTTNVANGTAVTNQTPTAKAFKPDKIWWYATTTTINASSVVGAQTLWRSGYNANNTTNGGMAICNFNSTISAYRLIYLCGTFDKATGLFSLRGGGTASSTQYYAQVPTNTANLTLSSYFTSGYDYILLGGTYSSNNYIQLFDNNPMFHFDGTNLVPYDTWNTAQASSNQTVKGNGTAFGANDAIDIVGSGTVTVTADTTNKKITITGSAHTVDHNQTVKGNGTAFGADAAVNIVGSGATTVTADTTNNKITINTPAVTDTNQTVKAGTVTFGANDAVNFVGSGDVTVTGNATNKDITISYTTPGSLKNPNPLDIYGNTTSVLSYDGSAKKSLYFKSSTSLGYFTVGDGTTSQAVYVGYSNTDTHYTSTFTIYGSSTSVATFNQSTNMTLSFAAGNNITLTPDASNHKITISATDTNTHYTSTWSVYAGTTCISTFNQSANRSLTFSAGNNITLTGTANSGIITISATDTDTHYTSSLSIYAGNTNVVTFNQAANKSVQFSAGTGITITGTASGSAYGIVTISATGGGGWAGTLPVSANSYYNGSLRVNEMSTNYGYASVMLFGLGNGSYYDAIYADTEDQDGIHIAQYSSTGRYLSIDYDNVNISGNTVIYGALYASRASFNGNGQTYISNSYISIYASSYNNTTYYSAILLSATNGIISQYAGRNLNLTANYSINLTTGAGYTIHPVQAVAAMFVGYKSGGTLFYTVPYSKTYATTGGDIRSQTGWTQVSSSASSFYYMVRFTRMGSSQGILDIDINTKYGGTTDNWLRYDLGEIISYFNAGVAAGSMTGSTSFIRYPTTAASWRSSYITVTTIGKRTTAYGTGTTMTALVGNAPAGSTGMYVYICEDNNNGGDREGTCTHITMPVYVYNSAY